MSDVCLKQYKKGRVQVQSQAKTGVHVAAIVEHEVLVDKENLLYLGLARVEDIAG